MTAEIDIEERHRRARIGRVEERLRHYAEAVGGTLDVHVLPSEETGSIRFVFAGIPWLEHSTLSGDGITISVSGSMFERSKRSSTADGGAGGEESFARNAARLILREVERHRQNGAVRRALSSIPSGLAKGRTLEECIESIRVYGWASMGRVIRPETAPSPPSPSEP